MPSNWEDHSVLEDEDACQEIESAEDEVVMWLHHTKARRARRNAPTWWFCADGCMATMSACMDRDMWRQHWLPAIKLDQCHWLQAPTHGAGTFDEAIFSRYIFRNVCAGASVMMPVHDR